MVEPLPSLKAYAATSPEMVVGGCRLRDTVAELPLKEAVRTAVCVVFTLALDAVKLAVVEPEDTVTEDGTETTEELELNFTESPLEERRTTQSDCAGRGSGRDHGKRRAVPETSTT